MITRDMTINHLGYKQVVDENDRHICPACFADYTNEGEGIICAKCGEDGEFAEDDECFHS